jgi:paraquat-inducible protein B
MPRKKMSDEPPVNAAAQVPTPAVGKRRRWAVSFVWAVPVIALLIGLSLVVQAIRQQGPTITVTFATAEGIEPGKTKVKFKDVDIGEVKGVHLADDRSRVVVTIDLIKSAEPFAVADSRFWVVRPRLAGTQVSGLATLLSGSYIGVDAGRSNDQQREFTGLEEPPVVASDVPGRRFTLHAADVGSLDAGSPVYFRRVLVGHIESFALDAAGRGITLQVWVNSPYDRFVTTDTRFWQASGLDVRIDAGGVQVQTQSLATILMGGIAFESPLASTNVTPADANTEFTLAADRAQAMKKPDGQPVPLILVFHQSVRGLTADAPVDFRGVDLGSVKSIGIAYDQKTRGFNSTVAVDIYPQRLIAAGASLPASKEHDRGHTILTELVAHGLRAQLRSGNLLTGQLFVAIDFFPDAPAVQMNADAEPLELPTVPSDLEELHQQISSILRKIDQIPVATLSEDAHRTMTSLDAAIRHIDAMATRTNADVLPQLRAMLEQTGKSMEAVQASLAPDAPLEQDTRKALNGVAEASRSLKALADSLERHPEALVRGKKGQSE